ncbi:MAG TPA: hypothetical protein VD926_15525 [Acidimicrobiales bacterium]|nr:hypothetical protein [Acidimicrobiales bacterium]
MEMPPGPPPLGAPAPPPSERYVEAELVETPEERRQALEDQAANRRLVATTAALALLAVAVMIGSFLLFGGADAEEAARPAPVIPQPSTTDPTGSATTTPEEATAATAEVDELVADLQAFVEEQRGLEFTEDVEVEVLDDAAYEDRVRRQTEEDLAEEPDSIEEDLGVLFALGLWDPANDPAEVLPEIVATASLGVYDPETGLLLVRGGEITPLVRTTIVHELTHALEDQAFDLDRPELDDVVDESSLAFDAVVEGSASRVEEAYRQTLTDEERDEEEAEESELASGIDATRIPPIIGALQELSYGLSTTFLDAVLAEQGDRALDRLLRRPPTTSEAILEPESFLAGEEPEEVDAPEAGGEVVDEGVAGQFLLHLIIDPPEVLEQQDGDGEPLPEWDGDRYVLWQDGEDWCVRIAVVGDLDGFEAGLQRWVDEVAMTGEVSNDGDVVDFTMCSP